jgi:hypothetical protein
MKVAILAIFCRALALLSVRTVHLHIADTYLDPTGRVDAQDEAMYASNAFHMARHGNWLIPVYRGRCGLYKSPLWPGWPVCRPRSSATPLLPCGCRCCSSPL